MPVVLCYKSASPVLNKGRPYGNTYDGDPSDIKRNKKGTPAHGTIKY